MNLKKHAFTLAEALITMVIIGVVAALTIPVIMANVFEKSYTTHAKNIFKQHGFCCCQQLVVR